MSALHFPGMEYLLYVLLGIGLAAACGFRVFVPLLVMSIASLTGHLQLASEFVWIGSWPALIVFAAATLLEIGAYYVPWLDNLLDMVATPAAIVAGIIVTASVVLDMSPVLRWPLAVIAGGGVAGVIQGATVMARKTSTLATAGIATPLVSTIESGGSVVMSVLSMVLPGLAGAIAVLLVFLVGIRLARRRRKR